MRRSSRPKTIPGMTLYRDEVGNGWWECDKCEMKTPYEGPAWQHVTVAGQCPGVPPTQAFDEAEPSPLLRKDMKAMLDDYTVQVKREEAEAWAAWLEDMGLPDTAGMLRHQAGIG